MLTPKNLKQALRRGFRVTDEAVRNAPENCGRTRGKIRLTLDAINEEGLPGGFEIVVPYRAQYAFGKPRVARANERF